MFRPTILGPTNFFKILNMPPVQKITISNMIMTQVFVY